MTTAEPEDTAKSGTPRRAPRRTGRASGGRRLSFWVGIGLLLAGVGMLGYVGWQMWGTNWVSKRHQRDLVSQLERAWDAPGAAPSGPAKEGDATALIRIPRFGHSYVVPVLRGTSTDVLSRGFGHFADSADPGEIGNFALAGHRVTHGEPLRGMPDLRPGDKVIVETADTVYTYELDTNPNDLIVPFTGIWVLDALPKNPDSGGPEPAQRPGQRLITLTTCSELFHTDNRMIAFGHLTGVEPRVATATADS